MASSWVLTGKPNYEPDLSLMPYHLDLRVQFDIPDERVDGTCCVFIRAIRNANFIVLNAINFQNVSVRCVQGDDIAWTYDGSVLQVLFVAGLFAGDERTIEIQYFVESPPKALHFSYPDENYPNLPTWVVSDHETERARYWIPCVDNPMVHTTADFHITAPSNLVAMACGTLISQKKVSAEELKSDGPEMEVSHWSLDIPSPSYLLCVTVGDFIRVVEPEFFTSGSKQVQIAYYTTPDNTPSKSLVATYGETKSIMEWLTGRLQTSFPLPKYFQVSAYGIGGAMENMTLVTWDDSWLISPEMRNEYSVEVNRLVLHEMAHTFFGNIVAVRHFSHAWLKEGWAHYMECVFLEERYGINEFKYELFRSAEAYMGECEQYVRPLVTREYEHSFLMYDKHLYPGGAWRIHMLRMLLGDSVFWEMTAKYLRKYWLKTVETAHFRLHVEEVSKRNLARFFDQWVYSPGFPKLTGEYEFDLKKGVVSLVLTQVQQNSHPDVNLFDFELEICFLFQSGVKKIVTVDFDQRKTASVQLFTPIAPVGIIFDPMMKWLFHIDIDLPLSMHIHVLKSGLNIRNQIWAGQALIRHGTSSAIRQVFEAIKNEKFFGIRLSLLEAMASCGTRFDRFVVKVLENEQNERCLFLMLSYCTFKSPALRKYLLRVLKGGKLAPLAQRHALRCLGSQEILEDIDLIAEKALADNGFPYHVNKGAITALGLHGSIEALRILCKSVEYGKLNIRLRPFCVDAIAINAARQPKQEQDKVTKLLEELLGDNQYQVRKDAIGALALIGSVSSIHRIRSTLPSLATQDHPWVDSQINTLISVGENLSGVKVLESQVMSLMKEVSDLNVKVNSLSNRLDDAMEKGYIGLGSQVRSPATTTHPDGPAIGPRVGPGVGGPSVHLEGDGITSKDAESKPKPHLTVKEPPKEMSTPVAQAITASVLGEGLPTPHK